MVQQTSLNDALNKAWEERISKLFDIACANASGGAGIDKAVLALAIGINIASSVLADTKKRFAND